MTKPCVIFDCHHPKHYLALRQLGSKCSENGVNVIWTAREKDVLVDLMRRDGNFPFVMTRAKQGLLRLFGELVTYDFKLLKLANKKKPAVLMGNSISIAHVGKLLKIPSLLINDDDAKANPQYPILGYPFASRIITPDCLKENYGKKHRFYPGLHELAYLHPKVFHPDPEIRSKLNVSLDSKIFLIRTVALAASHDVGEQGLSRETVEHLVSVLSKKGVVFISSENELTGDLAAYRFPLSSSKLHDMLAECDLFIGDSQTMAAEAAIVGTPSIRMNSFVNRIAYLNELEDRFDLTYGYKPDQKNEMLARVERIVNDTESKNIWRKKRDNMLRFWQDPTDVFWDELCRFI